LALITPDTSNSLFSLASEFVNNTSRHIFLTGKAGTGKTTFLRYIREQTHKNTVVAAPTGVAAINAGGVTLHSLFQLPFGPFVPDNSRMFAGSGATDPATMLKNLRLSGTKKELLQEMELLIIDEVSMLRADMLDAIDTILRSVRRNQSTPFGGVQVLFIGDLYQLPPVVMADEWAAIRSYYESPFFFHSNAVRQSPPLYIELKKIYRQNEQEFIDILNRVRNNLVLPEDLEILNERRIYPDDMMAPENMVTLTTHNKKADNINANELQKLRGTMHRFEGTVVGDFNENAYPTDLVLQLKEGAQVMFIKNDSGENRRFFNGKLATISRIDSEDLYLLPAGEQQELKLEKETWRNIRYNYNREKNKIEEEELGSFTQYPIRLAWAITIHKSQGLTFEKLIIDTGQAFAAGQVYVALSRCTSLSGLHLLSPIYASAIQTDPLVIAFAQKEANADELSHLLESEKQVFVYVRLRKLFDWNKLVTATERMVEFVQDKEFPNKEEIVEISTVVLAKVNEQKTFADKFELELRRLSAGGDAVLTGERIAKAISWFAKSIFESLILPLHNAAALLQGKTKTRGVSIALLETETVFWSRLQQIQTVSFPEFGVQPLGILYQKDQLPEVKVRKKEKQVKGSSQRESLQLFNEGKTVQEIAAHRALAISTIEGHLAQFVLTGDIEPQQLISQEKIDRILAVITNDAEPSSVIKDKLPPEYSFNDIRIVLNYRKRSKPVADL
jgi:hypothetical protein